MSFEVSIDTAALKERLQALIDLSGGAMEVAGRGMLNYFKDYHTAFIPRWKGNRHIDGGNGGRFGTEVVLGWQNPQRTSGTEITLRNIQPYLAHKIAGGPITPKRGAELTIPLIPEAKGRLAGEFATSKGIKLFRIGKTLAYKGPGGKPIFAYAVSRGVNQAPWPGAMPSTDAIQQQFAEALTSALKES